MGKRERSARRQRQLDAEQLRKQGRIAGRKFVRLATLDVLNKIGRDEFPRLLSMYPVRELPPVLAQYLTGQDSFDRMIVKSVRRVLNRLKLSAMEEQFVEAFVDGLFAQQLIEDRRIVAEMEAQTRREEKKRREPPPRPVDRSPMPRPPYYAPATSVSTMTACTQGNSMIAGMMSDIRARRGGV